MSNSKKIEWTFEGIDYDTNTTLIAHLEGDTYILATITIDEAAKDLKDSVVGYMLTEEEVKNMYSQSESADRQIGNFIAAKSGFSNKSKYRLLKPDATDTI